MDNNEDNILDYDQNNNIYFAGWGNFLKDEKCDINWQKSSLALPLEYSSIYESDIPELVINDKCNTKCNVYIGKVTGYLNFNEAVKLYAKRLDVNKLLIGYINLKTDESRTGKMSAALYNDLHKWMKDNCIDALIWNNLPSNFEDRSKLELNKENFEIYISKLSKKQKIKFEDYFFDTYINQKIKTNIGNHIKLNYSKLFE